MTETIKKPKNCLACGRVLDTSKESTTAFRTDGYCNAKCKRKDRRIYYDREYREEVEQTK